MTNGNGDARWKIEPLYDSGLPERPMPFSPVHSARKFSAWGVREIEMGRERRNASR